MDKERILEIIRETGSPMRRQLLTVALISNLLQKKGKEVPVGVLVDEDAPLEVVELGPELHCKIIGIEDLIIDRLNACKHWKSEIDCEMAELLIMRYGKELDWDYLEKKAQKPENDLAQELDEMKTKSGA